MDGVPHTAVQVFVTKLVHLSLALLRTPVERTVRRATIITQDEKLYDQIKIPNVQRAANDRSRCGN